MYSGREVVEKPTSLVGTDSAMVKNPPANGGDTGLIPGSGRSPGVGNGNPLHYSCLENPMDREAWQATVHGVTKSQTPLSTHIPKQRSCRRASKCHQ